MAGDNEDYDESAIVEGDEWEAATELFSAILAHPCV